MRVVQSEMHKQHRVGAVVGLHFAESQIGSAMTGRTGRLDGISAFYAPGDASGRRTRTFSKAEAESGIGDADYFEQD
jgi:phage-related minor tail protein